MFFELEDVKRRRTPYYDYYNNGTFVPPTDSTLSWNVQRGLIIGTMAGCFQGLVSNFYNNLQAVLKVYETPRNLRETVSMVQLVRSLENYKSGLFNKLSHGLLYGAINIAPKIALYRAVDGGWQNYHGGFDVLFPKKIPGVALVAALTAPISTAFQMITRAFYADKTFPPELRNNYRNLFQALWRVPYENGPYFLFKNSFPFMMSEFLHTLTMFYCHDVVRDILSVLHDKSEMPVNFGIYCSAGLATHLALIFSYPFRHTSRVMVDLWPDVAGSKNTYGDNYRKAIVHFVQIYRIWPNAFAGFFTHYYWQRMPSTMLTLLIADKLGIFNRWRTDILGGSGDNSPEDNFI